MDRLRSVLRVLSNDKSKLVIDLSCRKQDDTWVVAMNKWQTLTDMEVNKGKSFPTYGCTFSLLTHYQPDSIVSLEPYCSEFLIHAADKEGLQTGIDEDLVEKLGCWCSLPVTYAGGGKHIRDLATVQKLSQGRVDLTFGSALDIFGGRSVTFADCVAWNRSQEGVSTDIST